MGFSNSPLVSCTKISPNKTSPRTHAIDTITIHCVVGQVTVERLGDIFAPTSKHASSNYGVGLDGRIGMYVEEKDRSWCSSNADNDNRAITIEVASDSYHPYAVTDAAFAGLLDLVTDICKRNGIKKLVWSTSKNERVNHLNGCNMTVHRDYEAKSCPGDYLYNKHGEIAAEVNRRLGVSKFTEKEEDSPADEIKVGDVVKITGTIYYTGKSVPAWVRAKNWIVHSISGDRVVLNKSDDGKNAIMSPFHLGDLELAYAKKEEEAPAPRSIKDSYVSTGSEADKKEFHDYFMARLGNECGVAGLWGNVEAESSGRSDNMQNTYEEKLGFNDKTYTEAVDSGSYKDFVVDNVGYGIAQFTYWSVKQAMLSFAQEQQKSIADYQMQLDFLWSEIRRHQSVLDVLRNARTVKEASDIFMLEYERPKDQSDDAKAYRASCGQKFYVQFAQNNSPAAPRKCRPEDVIAVARAELDYHEKATNSNLDDKYANAGSGNFTKYARDFDEKYPRWYNGRKQGFAYCDIFLDWTFLTAFGYEKALELLCQPEESCGAGCVYSLRYYKAKGQLYLRDPKPGDQIFFGESLDIVHHTGLVEDVDGTYVYTIEGNTSDMVARRKYRLTDSSIVAYGRPNYDAVDAPVDVPETKETVPSYGYVLRFGASGGRVKDMQQKLESLGYGVVADFGDSTKSAVIKFQSGNGLLVDGEAGDQTLGKIDELIAAKE